MPDLFHQDPVLLDRPDDFDIMKWLNGTPGHLPNRVDPVIETVLKEMRTNLGCERIGAVRYCFGGKYVVRWLRPERNQINVGFVAHPSFVEPDELAGITGPLSISVAEIDEICTAAKRHESEIILPKTHQPYQINLFGGVEHGFAVRGDINSKVVRFAKEQAFLQAIEWFQQYL